VCELVTPESWYSVDPLLVNGVYIDGLLKQGCFIEDEMVLAVLSNNGHITFWDLETGRVLADLMPPVGKFTDIQLVNDKIILQSDLHIKVLDYKLERIIIQAKKAINGRLLTERERRANYCETQ